MAGIGAIIVGAGKGERLKSAVPKCLIEIESIPLLLISAFPFEKCDRIKSITLVVPAGCEVDFEEKSRQLGFLKVKAIVAGGKLRQDSVKAGLKTLPADIKRVLIHDGARPLLTLSSLEMFINSLEQEDAVTIASSVTDTLHTNISGKAEKGPNRSNLIAAQTPQGFKRDLLIRAFASDRVKSLPYTDEVSLVRKILGVNARVVSGETGNIKITHSDDLRFFMPQLLNRVSSIKRINDDKQDPHR